MNRYTLGAGLLAATLLTPPAFAQTNAPATPTPAAADVAPKGHSGHWRSSKLIGVNIYNEQNEKLGDINEIILDPAGKVTGYVVGVGGFLGMGEHDVLVEPTKIKFVNEPARSMATSTAPAQGGSSTNNTQAASSTTTTRAANEQWYPDHGILSATKDQLKAMPQFKYSSYN